MSAPSRRRLLLALPGAGLAGLSGLSGCAPLRQSPLPIPSGALEPRLEDGALLAFDGARLPATLWPAEGADGAPARPSAVIVALHGMDDYRGAFYLAGPAWASMGITTLAYDQRGFGRAPGRGIWPGAALLVSDLRAACAAARARWPDAPLAVVGESMGGAVAVAAFGGDDPPSADRLVLLSPAVWGWSSEPALYRAALWIAAHLDPAAELEPPAWVYRRHRATDNLQALRRMSRDPNLIFRTRIDAVYGLVDLMETASRRLSELRVPTLFAYGAHDEIIPAEAAERAAARLPKGAGFRTALYPQGWHLLNRDLGRAAVLGDVAAFIRDPDAPPPSGAGPIPPPAEIAPVRGRG